MVKNSIPKMDKASKNGTKKTPDISHLTGSPTKKELIAALVKERKELLKQFRSNSFRCGSRASFTANFTSYRVRFDTYLRLKAVNYLLNRFGI